MADPAGSDRTLLDRLNALKPTTVNLDTQSNTLSASTIQPAEPLSREDVLSKRLKTLRIQKESQDSDTTSPKPGQDGNHASTHALREVKPVSSSLAADIHRPAAGNSVATDEEGDTIDTVLSTDEQTLEDLLADLYSDEQWLDEVAAEVAQSKDQEHQRVNALLEELGKTPKETPEKQESGLGKRVTDYESSDDNSDGEHMTRQADDALAQAMDEVDFENTSTSQRPAQTARFPTLEDGRKPASQGDPGTSIQSRRSDDPFDLPTVPLDLQDQPHLPETAEDDASFVASIASRMAALKGLGGADRSLPSAPTAEVDDLGLPVAPKFAPEDRPVKGVYKRYGYTDEDAKTWCTVCLEDAAIRCFGCDDDVYCARCWKEMHVGPMAGYDERGHKWETFVRHR